MFLNLYSSPWDEVEGRLLGLKEEAGILGLTRFSPGLPKKSVRGRVYTLDKKISDTG